MKYLTIDIIRLLSFKREAIENAIFTQDVLDSEIRNDKVIKSYYAKERDESKSYNRLVNAISKSDKLTL